MDKTLVRVMESISEVDRQRVCPWKKVSFGFNICCREFKNAKVCETNLSKNEIKMDEQKGSKLLYENHGNLLEPQDKKDSKVVLRFQSDA